MRTALGVPLGVLLIALGATACARDDGSGPGSTASDTASPTASSAVSSPGSGSASVPSVTDSPDDLPPGVADHPEVQAAIADLSARLDVPATAITILAVDDVTWRDSAIGCPQKGMQYLQVLTDGMRIILEVDRHQYHYHAGGKRSAFYCAAPEAPVGE